MVTNVFRQTKLVPIRKEDGSRYSKSEFGAQEVTLVVLVLVMLVGIQRSSWREEDMPLLFVVPAASACGSSLVRLFRANDMLSLVADLMIAPTLLLGGFVLGMYNLRDFVLLWSLLQYNALFWKRRCATVMT